MESKRLVLKASEDPEQLPDIKPGPFYTIKASGAKPTIPLIRVRSKLGEVIMIQTESFYLHHGPVKTQDGTYLFAKCEEDSPQLHSLITRLESAAELSLKSSLQTNELNIPDKYRRTLYRESDEDKNLRPTYNPTGTAFFKLAADCQVYNWMGRQTVKEELDRGRYQIILRASNIYIGQHGHTPFPASLQFKVAQIRYDPAPEKSEEEIKEEFLFLPENDIDYSVNNPPPGQQHCVELGLVDLTDEDTRDGTSAQSTSSVSRRKVAHQFETPKKRKSNTPLKPPNAPKKRKRDVKRERSQVKYIVDLDAESPASPDITEMGEFSGGEWVPNVEQSQIARDPNLWNSQV